MFRATVCPSSGETTVFMRPLVLVTDDCQGMQGGMKFHPAYIVARNVEIDKYTKK
jgi:hypothetical protein